MKFGILALSLAAAFMATPAQAATLQITYINETPPSVGFPDATRITFRFANDIDNAALFDFSSFYDRIWYRPEILTQGVTGQPTTYPADNFVGTILSSAGLLYDSSGEIVGTSFDLQEFKPGSPGFTPGRFEYYSHTKRLTLWALYSATGGGGPFRFYLESFEYNPTGTAADFAAPLAETPLPAAVWMFGSVLAGAGIVRKLRRKRISGRPS